ncbi:MAG: hypothetical protein PHZ25_03990 [Candidatus Pacebacteria bacterium]|nr:hypothetical protein [Candidatus Paceibacterota bacterium]
MASFYFFLFLISCSFLIYAGNLLVKSLSRISEFLGWKEFTVSFFLMSLATASPELFIGGSSVFRGASELSLGNIIGQNIIHFTLATAICVFLRGGFSIRSKTTRLSAWFAGFMAVLPLLLIIDGSLSRVDGFLLIFSFFAYIFWLMERKERFEKKFIRYFNGKKKHSLSEKISIFFKDFGSFFMAAALLIISSQGIVSSSVFFANLINMPLVVIGALIVGLGTALPEIYFSALAAEKGKGDLMAGNLFGSTVISTSLVLGLVAVISPISGIATPSYLTSRLFLFVSVALFIYFMATGRKISIKEASVLLLVYVVYVLSEISLAGFSVLSWFVEKF